MFGRSKSKKNVFHRKVSPAEKVFVIYNKNNLPVVIHSVLEGTGNLDESLWKEAVAAACEANPGSRLIYNGRWTLGAKWVDSGAPPPIRCIEGSHWSGYDSENAPFLFEPLPFKNSHSSEILLVKSNPPRVIFRAFHATMDGGGLVLWMLDIFRALRKEPLVGSNSASNDSDLVAKLKFAPKRLPKNIACLSPTGLPEGSEKGLIWKRTTIEGRFSKLLPQLALAIAKEARKQGPGNVRLAIPLDLRKRVPNLIDIGNLTRRILLDVPPDATVESIQQDLKDQLDNLNSDSIRTLLIHLPMGLIAKLLKTRIEKNWNAGFFVDTGTISNLGRMPMEKLHGGGFKAEACYFLPPELPGKPSFITMSGTEKSVEMITTMPKMLASNGRLDTFIANIVAELKPNC